jgi:hypothetical protein
LTTRELPGWGWLPEFGIEVDLGLNEANLLECLLREFADSQTVGPELPPHSFQLGVAHGPIMLSRWLMDITGAKSVGVDIAVALGVYELTHSGGLSAAIAALRKVRATFSHLSEAEQEIVRRFVRATDGDIYNHRVPEAELLATWPDDPAVLLEHLDEMEQKDYLIRHRDGWTLRR